MDTRDSNAHDSREKRTRCYAKIATFLTAKFLVWRALIVLAVGNFRAKMDGRRKTNAFLSSLDEDLLIYEEELKKRGFTSSTTLKYLREHDLEDIGMADGHKRLLMNAVSKLQSPQQAKDCKPLPSKKRRIPFVVIDDSQVGSTSFDRKEYLSDDDTKAKQLSEQKQVSTIAI